MSDRYYDSFNEIKIGGYFRLAGYDDLLIKVDDKHAKSLGCGWLNKPIRFARKGTKIDMSGINDVLEKA